MGERYTPHEQDVFDESREATDDKRKGKGAEEKANKRIEFTKDQVERAKEEMQYDMKHSKSPDRKKHEEVEDALDIKIERLNSDLLPVWNEMRTLDVKLPHDVSMNLGKLEGKYHPSHRGLANRGGDELAKLRDQRDYIKTYKSIHPDKESADLNRFEELLNDPKLEEFWRTRQELEAVQKQK